MIEEQEFSISSKENFYAQVCAGKAACPFWRRSVVLEDAILALCGAEYPGQKPLENDVDFPVRLEECPIYNGARDFAIEYKWPAIIEVFRYPVPDANGYLVNNRAVLNADSSGSDGIAKLLVFWPEEVEKFIARHAENLKPPAS